MLLARGGDRGPRDLSLARRAARDARPARGVPPRGRRAVRARLRARRDAEPVHRLQRRLSVRAVCSRLRAAPARTRLRRGTTPASSSIAAEGSSRARSIPTRTSPTCSRSSTRRSSSGLSFPLGEQTKPETRAEAERAGLAVARRDESQEACFLAGDDYRAFLERRGLAAREGPIVDEDGRELGRHSGYWRFTPGQREGLGVVGAAAAVRDAARTRATNTVVVGPREARWPARTVDARGRLYCPVERADAKLRYRSDAVPARRSRRRPRAVSPPARPEPPTASRQARPPSSTKDDVVVGAGL